MKKTKNKAEARAARDARIIRDAKHYAISGIRLADKYYAKQKKHIDRGVGLSSIESEHQFLGYLDGKKSHLEAMLRILRNEVK